MIVVLDTNALVQVFGQASPFGSLREALRHGKVEWAVSTPILLEYEEVIRRSSGQKRWEDMWSFLTLIDLLHGTIRRIGPRYRFHTITGDADDDAFADCAIVVGADWIITSDHHFDALIGSGYEPQPIAPEEFIRRCQGGM